MTPKLFTTALLLLFFLFSCNRPSDLKTEDLQMPGQELKKTGPPNNQHSQQKFPLNDQAGLMQDTVASLNVQAGNNHIDWDKKIIKTANVTLEIGNFKKYNEMVHGLIRKFGGYIAQEEQHLTDEKSETILSIKVPVDQFESMLNELPPADAKMLERTITSQDVSAEIIDTKARLESKRQARLKYLDFLKASKNMEEVLKVQNEINELQEEMEAAAGRVEYLSHQSAFSTIHLTFYQPSVAFKPVDNNPTFLVRVSQAFRLGADWIASLFIALLSIWPLLLLATIGFFVVKRMKFVKSNLQNP